ncbi:winged helix-turn-helix transcriptional regulator [Parapedobacter tibetensis]|uniref:winged helix-turn-helix transcriptional regulator n=1 Tax=Parapedobacter tibetensis TaxID=2972951 RepID=UPI00214D4AF3|nr:winged helix-turn-helix transcriptional regulator [Parapedobacter tibetensis]
MRYGELRRAIRDITPKMLTQTLRELEDDKLITRKVYHEVPPKVEYSLTETGAELIPFIDHLRQWGDRQIEKEKLNPILC